jgi:hypothetical protein
MKFDRQSLCKNSRDSGLHKPTGEGEKGKTSYSSSNKVLLFSLLL